MCNLTNFASQLLKMSFAEIPIITLPVFMFVRLSLSAIWTYPGIAANHVYGYVLSPFPPDSLVLRASSGFPVPRRPVHSIYPDGIELLTSSILRRASRVNFPVIIRIRQSVPSSRH